MTEDSLTPDEVLVAARRLAKNKNPSAAVALYKQVLARYPRHKKARKELKLLQRAIGGTGDQARLPSEMAKLMHLYTAGQPGPALLQAKRLCKLYPDQPMPYNIIGVILTERGDNEAAVSSYEQALALEPGYTDALNNLGSAQHSLKRHRDAIASYSKVIQLDPHDADAYFNMGNAYTELKQPAEALNNYEKSIEIRPLFAQAHLQMGNALLELGKFNQAIAAYRNAMEIDPKLVDAYISIGVTMQRQRQYDMAIAWYKDAINLQPNYFPAHKALASVLLKVGKQEEATAAWRTCLELDPDSDIAHHFLNAAKNIASDIAPRKYIEELFDDHAPNFENHLVTRLGYNAPETLKQLVCEYGLAGNKVKNAIDLGCGTGLSGMAFRDVCESLAGVDLSTQMLSQSKEKAVYDSLHAGDVIDVLNKLDTTFELFICADILVYIGNLEPLLATLGEYAAGNALLALTTEHLDSGDYELRTSGRYAHSKDYVLQTAATAGFELISFNKQDLRKESLKWLPGGYYLFNYTAKANTARP